MNICIIGPKGFPVPAVKGGAVETLITNFIEENEKRQKIFIDVITIYDKSAVDLKKSYQYTNFIDVKLQEKMLVKFLPKFGIARRNVLKRI